MADIYVRSTDGSDADNGSTWALAKATLAGAAAIDAAGDVIYISDNHAESSAAAQSIALAGTNASPVRVICGDDAAEPPTAVSTAGSVTTTSANSITLSGSASFYGLTFSAGTGLVNANLNLNSYVSASNCVQTFIGCSLRVPATGGAAYISIGHPTTVANLVENTTIFENCTITTGSLSGGGLVVLGTFYWNGGSILSGHTASSTGLIRAFSSAGRAARAFISGVDLQHMGSSQAIFTANSTTFRGVIRNCRLPSGWTGSLASGTLTVGDDFRMYNCDSGDTNYRLWFEQFAGSVLSETTIVRTGGASDGTTTLSWKMVSNSNAEYPLLVLSSPEIVRWNETTGSAITVTVEVITDNVTLTDEDAWLEVQYLGTSGVPLGSFVNDAKADVLATAANQATSTETWTTTGLTTPVKQKLAVTFTPQEKGYIHAVVKLAKASTTVYVDPELTVP